MKLPRLHRIGQHFEEMKLPQLRKIGQYLEEMKLPQLRKIGQYLETNRLLKASIFGGLAGAACVLAYDYFEQKNKAPKVTAADAKKHFNDNYKEQMHCNESHNEYNNDFEGYINSKITPKQKLKMYCNGQVKRERVYENNEFSYPQKIVGYNYYETVDESWKELVKEVKYNRDGDTVYYYNKYDK